MHSIPYSTDRRGLIIPVSVTFAGKQARNSLSKSGGGGCERRSGAEAPQRDPGAEPW